MRYHTIQYNIIQQFTGGTIEYHTIWQRRRVQVWQNPRPKVSQLGLRAELGQTPKHGSALFGSQEFGTGVQFLRKLEKFTFKGIPQFVLSITPICCRFIVFLTSRRLFKRDSETNTVCCCGDVLARGSFKILKSSKLSSRRPQPQTITISLLVDVALRAASILKNNFFLFIIF